MPSYALDHEADESDVVATTERPALVVKRRVVRKRVSRPSVPPPEPPPEPIEEIAPEDILLEAFAEPPRSQTMRPPPPPAETERLLSQAGIHRASGVVEAAPGGRAVSAHPVDQRIREALKPPQWTGPVPAYAETPSVAPVAMPSVGVGPLPPSPRRSRSRVSPWLLWALALLACGVAAGLTFVLLSPPETFARARALARALADRARAPREAAPAAQASAARTLATAEVGSAAPPAPPAPSSTAATAAAPESVPVDSLKEAPIPSKKTRVTFPASAEGHRIFVDSRPLPTGTAPALLKCGKHNIRIGSGGKVRKVDLPCGQTFALE